MTCIHSNRASLLFRTASAAALVATGVLGLAGAATAQDVESVVVTGSRIGTPGFTTPTPVTEITPLQYEVKNISTIVELIADIPTLTPNQNQNSVVDVGGSFFNLRGLGSGRTLALVNGLRTQATSVNGGYDINVIPASLVSHIDIVTGGASAAYGSDAIGGVVNVTLNTRLTGLRGKASTGMSDYGDYETDTASLAWGTEFAGGRGHFVIGGDYFHNLGLAQQNQRPFGRKDWGMITDPACSTITTTCTDIYILPGVINAGMADGGTIASGPLKDIQFGPGGVLMPFTGGALRGGTFAIGGSGSRMNETGSLQPTVGRDNALISTEYDLTDSITVWEHLLYSRSTQWYSITPNYDNASVTITNQNPYIPAALVPLMTAAKITSFVLSRSNPDIGPRAQGRDLLYGRNEDYDLSFGVKGKIDALGSAWDWDLGGQYSTHEYLTIATQNRRQSLFTLATDAVPNPATGGVAGVAVGQAVCRSRLTDPTSTCVPVDLFGPGTIDSAAMGYFMGTSWIDAQMDMQDVAFNLKGTPFATWAGPVSVATGAEYRRQTTTSNSDPASIILDWKNANATPYKGNQSVEEGYLEFGVPLLKDSPFGTALDLDLAGRLTSYSTSGGVSTWKVGLNYSVTDDVRFRASRSHDIRAPNLQELYQTGVLRTGSSIHNPVTNVTSITQSLTSGNPNLTPEIGDTITAGVVYSPSWLDGFNISLDYWSIKLTDQIVNVSGQTVVDNCLQFKIQSFCPAISYSATTGQISIVASTGFNVASLKTDGWDMEAGYNFAAEDLWPGLGGSIQLHMLATYLSDYVTNQFGIINNTADSISAGRPRLRSNLSAIWLNDPWRVSVNGNWEGGGSFSSLYNTGKYTYAQGGRTINNNVVNGRFYINLSVNYKYNDTLEFYTNARNLLNVQPPIVPDTVNFQHAVGSQALYDRIGGQWSVGVKVAVD